MSVIVGLRRSQTSYNKDNGIQTYFALEETAAGNPDIEAIIVMDGVTDAWVSSSLEPRSEGLLVSTPSFTCQAPVV